MSTGEVEMTKDPWLRQDALASMALKLLAKDVSLGLSALEGLDPSLIRDDAAARIVDFLVGTGHMEEAKNVPSKIVDPYLSARVALALAPAAEENEVAEAMSSFQKKVESLGKSRAANVLLAKGWVRAAQKNLGMITALAFSIQIDEVRRSVLDKLSSIKGAQEPLVLPEVKSVPREQLAEWCTLPVAKAGTQ